MDLHLIQRDHPHSTVNDWGLSHDDPYFQACWGPLLDARTAHFVGTVARLTRDGDRTLGLDELCHELDPAPATAQTRLDTVTRAIVDAARAGLGQRLWMGPTRQGFCVYRNVALLDEASLRRLTDAELFAHTSAVSDVNRRLDLAGQPPARVPPWLADRLHRASPEIPRGSPNPTAAAMARLGALRQTPPPPSATAPSL
jgi:hypothetical protein